MNVTTYILSVQEQKLLKPGPVSCISGICLLEKWNKTAQYLLHPTHSPDVWIAVLPLKTCCPDCFTL